MMIWNLGEELEYFIIWDNSQIKYYVIVILTLVENMYTFRVSTGHCPQSEISEIAEINNSSYFNG